MPLYDYKCSKCGVFEVEQSIKDAILKTCPTCGSAIKRLISLSGIVLKGSGFYSTDNRKGKTSEASGSAEKKIEKKPDTPASTTTASTAKTETKATPAAKPKA